MASFVYNNAIDNIVRGEIAFQTNSFKIMLVTASHTPNQDTHEFRSSVTADEVGNSGTYAAGGSAVTATVQSIDTANDDVEVSFGGPYSWTSATIASKAAIIYKDTGNAATDPLICYVDFGGTVNSTNGTFTVTLSSNLVFDTTAGP